MRDLFFGYFLSHLLAASEYADPTLPLIAIGCIIVLLVAFFIRRSGRRERRLKKNILPDSTLEFECEVGRQKNELSDYFKKEKYNYASGFIPGAEPELSFIDPARRGDPIEIITARETFSPSAEPLVERPITAADKMVYPRKTTPMMSKPYKQPKDNIIPPPLYSTEKDIPSIKKPELARIPNVRPPASVSPLVKDHLPRMQGDAAFKPREAVQSTEMKGVQPTVRADKVDTTHVVKHPINEAAPSSGKAEVPKIAFTDSVKKVQRKPILTDDTHRVVISTIAVTNPKPQKKSRKKKFKVSVSRADQ